MQAATPSLPLHRANGLCHTYCMLLRFMQGHRLYFFLVNFYSSFPTKATTFAFLFGQVISIRSDKCICLKYAKDFGL